MPAGGARTERSDSLFNHSLQNRKTFQPLSCLQDNQKSRPNVSFIKHASPVNRSLAAKRSDRFQTSLNRHQTKFLTKVIRIDRLQSDTTSRLEQEQPMSTYFSQRRRRRL